MALNGRNERVLHSTRLESAVASHDKLDCGTMLSGRHSSRSPGRSLSPLVPTRVDPDLDFGLTLEHLAEELLDLRTAGESLCLLRRLPGVDAKKLPSILGV